MNQQLDSQPRAPAVRLLLIGLLLTVPGVALRFTHFTETPEVETVLFFVAVLGAAFLLGAAAELAELEIPRGLTLALVALVAILPEYAVDFVFAWKAADDPEFAQFAAANMTGANRLLIGIGWSAVALIFWYRRRRPLVLERRNTVELTFLLIATVWAFTIFLRGYFRDGSLNIVDSVVLIGLFGIYVLSTLRGQPQEKPEIRGPMAGLATLPKSWRRALLVGLFAVPAVIIFAVAEPFADSLVASGRSLGIDEFILVQWLAPLASEAPEISIAIYFTVRGMGAMAMGLLISSKVNQWTLLVGSLPLVYSVSLGSVSELPLDSRQLDEFLLTAAQSLFAVLLLAALTISWRGALILLVLFMTQLFFTDTTARMVFSLIYLGLSVVILTWSRDRRGGVMDLAAGAARSVRTLRLGPLTRTGEG